MSGKGWWNSAISGLESRLDTILAEEGQTSAKTKSGDATPKEEPSEKAVDGRLSVEQARNAPRSRPNSRLQDRLAKAVGKGSERAESRASSDFGSRPDSPALPAIGGAAGAGDADVKIEEAATEKAELVKEQESRPDTPARTSLETATTVTPPANPLTKPQTISEQPTSTPMSSMIMPSTIPSQTMSTRQSIDSPSKPSLDIFTPTEPETPSTRDPDVLISELSALQNIHEETVRSHRDELHAHLERIDALQSKLTYLSQQMAESAKAVVANGDSAGFDKKYAEKDVQIASLLEEGQKLSKTEMKHLTAIKKMRTKAQEQDKELSTIKVRLSKAEKSITEQSERAKRAEAAEKSAQEKLQIVDKIKKDIDAIRVEKEEAGLTIAELRRQLDDALSRAEDAEARVKTGALEAEKRVTVSLQEDIDNLRIEKKLADDRAKRELQASREETNNQQEKAKLTELELRGEIANLESKLEILRSRTEEATSQSSSDSQPALLRQIETLQTQYSLASQNWQGIETTLTSRVVALEKERDETAKRESDVRRKAREVNSKARRLEDELESINERARALEHDLAEQTAAARNLQSRATQAESNAQDARTTLEREKSVWEAEFQQRLEDEKNKWKLELSSQPFMQDPSHLRADSPSTSVRRHSPDPLGLFNRRSMPRSISGTDMAIPLSPLDRMLEEQSRRPSSSARPKSTQKIRTPDLSNAHRSDSIASHLNTNINGASNGMSIPIGTPLVSAPGAGIPYTPSIEPDEAFDTASSPHHTINEMLSVSTAAAGPSVQLVERMSAAVRRLEADRAASRDELARLTAQRDEARDEVVTLMREVEEKRVLDERVRQLEGNAAGVEERYQAALELLGEKTERVDELEGDVADLKKIYRELVQTMGP